MFYADTFSLFHAILSLAEASADTKRNVYLRDVMTCRFCHLGKNWAFIDPADLEVKLCKVSGLDGHRVLKAIIECRENTQCIAVVEHNDNMYKV